MPQIKTFDTPQLGLHPTETGINATAAAARRVGAEYNEAAGSIQAAGKMIGGGIVAAGDVAVKYLEHQDISRGAPAFANFEAAKTKEWNDNVKNADPNDPTLGPKFLEGLEPQLDKFKSDGFLTEGGQKWAEARVDAFREHMLHKTTADMASLAGEAAKVNFRQTTNALSNTVRGDPTSLDYALRTAETSIGAMVDSSPNLTGVAAGKVKTELLQQAKESIIKSAALGHISQTGSVPEWASDPKFAPYINGAELKQFEQQARYFQRLNESENRAARAMREHDEKLDFHQQVNDLEIATMPKNVGDQPTLPQDYWSKLRDLSQHPGAAQDPGRIKTMVTNGEAITARLNKREPLGPVSHDTTMDLLRRMRATDESRLTDNGPIYDAYQGGKLNNSDFNFLTREFSNMRTPEGAMLEKDRGQFQKTFSRLIDGGMNDAGIHSVLGTQRMYEFEMDARRQEGVLRAQGKDPHLVYDPRSEHYWGSPENIAKYRVSLQEANRYAKTLESMDAAAAKGDKAAPPARQFTPPPSWEFSPSRKQYRDPATKKIYDLTGKEVK
jgi:hypothetical protein